MLAVRPNVLIVDDHADFRSLARLLLEAEDFPVVGEAADGTTALRLAHELQPDLVLLDVQLPDLSGFEVADRLAAADCPPLVILTSTRDGSDYPGRLSRSPALGFIAKGDLSGATIAALLQGRWPPL